MSSIKKAQSSIELLTIYGFGILAVLGAAIFLSNTGIFNPKNCLIHKAGFSQVIPVDWGAYKVSGVLAVKIESWAGDDILVKNAT
ncbi:MAG: hypothetical protein JW724_01120, partial [Candidatus Altiarchaeota archaeon]|nr:hypothetical protein [Candidatus Altiarchaeota archaeon]